MRRQDYRTTRKMIDSLVELIARELNVPCIAWSKEPDGTLKPNSGALVIEGWKPDDRPRRFQLTQMDTKGSSGEFVIDSSWFNAYEMKTYLRGILCGIDSMKGNPGNRGIKRGE